MGAWAVDANAPKGTWGERLSNLSEAFRKLPIEHDKVSEIAVEFLKGAANSPMLNCISGIFIQHLPNATLKQKSFLTASKWKAHIRKVTKEKSPLPKGITSLKLFDPSTPDMTDDCADAVMIGLTYLANKK